MVKTYSNCTVVLENLEITYMEPHRDLSFLRVKTGFCSQQRPNMHITVRRGFAAFIASGHIQYVNSVERLYWQMIQCVYGGLVGALLAKTSCWQGCERWADVRTTHTPTQKNLQSADIMQQFCRVWWPLERGDITHSLFSSVLPSRLAQTLNRACFPSTCHNLDERSSDVIKMLIHQLLPAINTTSDSECFLDRFCIGVMFCLSGDIHAAPTICLIGWGCGHCKRKSYSKTVTSCTYVWVWYICRK